MKKFPKILILTLIGFQSLNAQDIFIATASGDPAAIDAAIQAGADINTINSYVTPLIVAIGRNNLYIVNFLLTRGANPNIGNNLGSAIKKVFDPAQKYYQTLNLEIANLLLDSGAKVDPASLANAIDAGDKKLIEKMLAQHLDRETLNYALIKIENPKIEDVELLMKHGAFIHRQFQDGITILDKAILKLNVDLVRWLLEHGVNPNTKRTFSGEVTLLMAVTQILALPGYTGTEAEEIFELLLKHGADAQAIDSHNNAVIDYLPATSPLRDLLKSYYKGGSGS